MKSKILNDGSRILKKTGDGSKYAEWWLRFTIPSAKGAFASVSTGGSMNNDESPTKEFGVAPGFCI